VLPLAAAVLLWYLLTADDVVLWLRFDKLPGPVEVYDTLRTQLTSGAYYQDLLASLRRILIGFGLAAVSGVAIGITVGRSRLVRVLVRPLIEVARPIPAIALVPLAILMFPTGEQGIVFITFFAAFFPVVVSTIHAMKTLPDVWEEAARTMGAGRFSVLAHVILPGAMPGIFSGLSVSVGVAWICVISAEMISGQFGIGYYTWQSYGLLDYSGVVVGMLSIGLLGWSAGPAAGTEARLRRHAGGRSRPRRGAGGDRGPARPLRLRQVDHPACAGRAVEAGRRTGRGGRQARGRQ
jgi:NitT/TauT family transport system permease protein